MNEKHYLYILVRTDLPTPAQIAVQAIHAAFRAAIHIKQGQEYPHVVLCGVGSEEALQREVFRLCQTKLPVYPFCEPDFGDELTSVAVGPTLGRCKKLSAWKILEE